MLPKDLKPGPIKILNIKPTAMKQETLDNFIKELFNLPYKEHIIFFDQVRKLTFERLKSEAERFNTSAKEIQEYIKEKFSNG